MTPKIIPPFALSGSKDTIFSMYICTHRLISFASLITNHGSTLDDALARHRRSALVVPEQQLLAEAAQIFEFAEFVDTVGFAALSPLVQIVE